MIIKFGAQASLLAKSYSMMIFTLPFLNCGIDSPIVAPMYVGSQTVNRRPFTVTLCSCPSTGGFCKTFSGKGLCRQNLTPDGMQIGYSIH